MLSVHMTMHSLEENTVGVKSFYQKLNINLFRYEFSGGHGNVTKPKSGGPSVDGYGRPTGRSEEESHSHFHRDCC